MPMHGTSAESHCMNLEDMRKRSPRMTKAIAINPDYAEVKLNRKLALKKQT